MRDWFVRQLTPPPSVPAAQARQYRTHVMITLAFVGGHALLGGLLAAMGQRALGAVYLASIAVNLVALVAGRRGRWQLGVDLNCLEFLANATAMSYLLGLRSGYVVYFPMAPLACMLMVPGDWLRRVAYIGLGYGVGALVVATATAPILTVPEWGVKALFWVNVGACINGIVNFGLWGSLFVERSERELAVERERSDRLLRNILPDDVVARLKDETRPIADDFSSVSVLFADIVGFTRLAARISARELVALLDELFSSFDALIEKHGLEKIKTIGDAYMVVGGVPRPRADHAAAVAALALDMLAAVRAHAARTGHALDVRIGIHSGPVVAGVIGAKKFAYDLWGDTVNTASRMESHGVPGRIQLTKATVELLGDRYPLVERGSVEVKGIGALQTWFLER